MFVQTLFKFEKWVKRCVKSLLFVKPFLPPQYTTLMFQWIIWIQGHVEQDSHWPKSEALQHVFHQPTLSTLSGWQIRKAGQPAKSDKLNLDVVPVKKKWAIVDDEKSQNGRRRLGIGRIGPSWTEGCSRLWFPAKRCGRDHQHSVSGEQSYVIKGV